MGLIGTLRRLERASRPTDPEMAAALARRWRELPATARTPAQVLGRRAVGCEGTHGVFPKCNLTCTPCYHSADANRVRTDGQHTKAQVGAQMALLRRLRGPHAHAQLIGGEVSLLSPEDHAETLEIMRAAGREPMSMTHGDFDYDYLRRLAVGPDGHRRLPRLSFAAHFDILMRGRRGVPHPTEEAELNPFRQAFVAMLRRLRREHGVRFFAAHNMTVSPANVGQVAQVIRDCHAMGYGMFSFQPAAFVGDDRRWREDYHGISADAVWAEIERGAGARLDYRVVQHGDLRCNRVAYGFYVGDHWYPAFDAAVRRDLAVRDAFYRHLAGIAFAGTPPLLLAAQLARLTARHPHLLALALGWLARQVRRVGPVRLVRHGARPVSFVMHTFMDAAQVAPAWAAMQRGETAADPLLRETQERLAACHYAMAHPENGTLVPACVQHAVLDPAENAQLRVLLPMPVRRAEMPA